MRNFSIFNCNVNPAFLTFVAIKAAISPIQLNRIEKGNSGVKRQTIIDIVEAINDHSPNGYTVNIEEALNKAGFSIGSKPKPQNAAEFAQRLQDMGFEIQTDFDWEFLGPDDLQDIIDDIEAKLLFRARKKKEELRNA